MCLPLITLIGAIPFFLNNLMVSGNPLTPAYLVEEKAQYRDAIIQVIPVDHAIDVSRTVTINPIAFINDIIGTIGHYVFSLSPNPHQDLYGILFFPASGSLGFFFVTPLTLVALLILPVIVLKIRARTCDFSATREYLLLCLVASGAVFLAYIHGLSGLNSSHGIGPDIRYLSPVYIPAILFSLMVLEKTVLFANPKTLVRRSCLIAVIFVPLLMVVAILVNPVWSTYTSGYMAIFKILILAEALVITGISYGYHITNRRPDTVSDLLLPALVVTVLAWQMMMIFLICPVAKFNGYTFWIPGVDALYHYFIHVTVLP
jgi:hypothetical protein